MCISHNEKSVIWNLGVFEPNVDLLFLKKKATKMFGNIINPIVDITATQGTETDNQHQKKDKERKQTN